MPDSASTWVSLIRSRLTAELAWGCGVVLQARHSYTVDEVFFNRECVTTRGASWALHLTRSVRLVGRGCTAVATGLRHVCGAATLKQTTTSTTRRT